jgi:hypothetical protein
MLKKLNNKLLSQYPLLWNTKLIYVLPAALITHLLFYIGGYMTSVDITNLTDYRYLKEFGTAIFSSLVSIVIIILWLVYYLRNNPFKSFYTISRNYLFAEFLLIAVVFFSTSTFFLTYQQGKFDKIKSATNATNLADEVNTINLSSHFIAYDLEDFSEYRNCNIQKERDREDSLRKAIEKSNNSQLSNTKTANSDFSFIDYDPYRDPGEQYSYLHYCGQEIRIASDKDAILNKYQLDTKAKNWLLENHTDSVLQLFNKLIDICKKYNVKYVFSPDVQIGECFGDSAFTVNRVFESSYSEYNRNRPPYIDLRNLRTTIAYVDFVRKGFWESELFLFWLVFALSAAIILFSFRITRVKHWFVGLIGVGLWSIIIVLSVVIFNLKEGVIPFVLLLWLLLTVFSVKQIISKKAKLLSGIVFNWIFWFTPAVIPLIIAQIGIISAKKCFTLAPIGARTAACDTSKWLTAHWEHMAYGNIVIMLVLIYFAFIPLARKWQSNPEE